MRTRSILMFSHTLVIAAMLAGALPLQAAEELHSHEHSHATAATAQLELDDGAKWPTDASLRSGMAEIRALFDADHPSIHAGTESDIQYTALADRIDQRVQTIVAQCKLPAAADANLHLIVADLLQGISLMRGEDASKSRHDGAALVHGALQAYPEYFDDAGWTPGRSMH